MQMPAHAPPTHTHHPPGQLQRHSVWAAYAGAVVGLHDPRPRLGGRLVPPLPLRCRRHRQPLLPATGAAASWQCAACRLLTLMLLQAKRSLLLRLPHLLQYNQKGAISERAAMKGPMPGKKL